MKFFNLVWLFFRIKKEIFSPSTFLGKKIIYFFIKIFSINKKKQNNSTCMIAVYDLNINTSADGRLLLAPENVILEVKYPKTDLRGTVR